MNDVKYLSAPEDPLSPNLTKNYLIKISIVVRMRDPNQLHYIALKTKQDKTFKVLSYIEH